MKSKFIKSLTSFLLSRGWIFIDVVPEEFSWATCCTKRATTIKRVCMEFPGRNPPSESRPRSRWNNPFHLEEICLLLAQSGNSFHQEEMCLSLLQVEIHSTQRKRALSLLQVKIPSIGRKCAFSLLQVESEANAPSPSSGGNSLHSGVLNENKNFPLEITCITKSTRI